MVLVSGRFLPTTSRGVSISGEAQSLPAAQKYHRITPCTNSAQAVFTTLLQGAAHRGTASAAGSASHYPKGRTSLDSLCFQEEHQSLPRLTGKDGKQGTELPCRLRSSNLSDNPGRRRLKGGCTCSKPPPEMKTKPET